MTLTAKKLFPIMNELRKEVSSHHHDSHKKSKIFKHRIEPQSSNIELTSNNPTKHREQQKLSKVKNTRKIRLQHLKETTPVIHIVNCFKDKSRSKPIKRCKCINIIKSTNRKLHLPSCKICDTTGEIINNIVSVHIAKKVILTTTFRTNIKKIKPKQGHNFKQERVCAQY